MTKKIIFGVGAKRLRKRFLRPAFVYFTTGCGTYWVYKLPKGRVSVMFGEKGSEKINERVLRWLRHMKKRTTEFRKGNIRRLIAKRVG